MHAADLMRPFRKIPACQYPCLGESQLKGEPHLLAGGAPHGLSLPNSQRNRFVAFHDLDLAAWFLALLRLSSNSFPLIPDSEDMNNSGLTAKLFVAAAGGPVGSMIGNWGGTHASKPVAWLLHLLP